MKINVSAASKILTIAASILCVGATISYLKVGANQKNLALTILVGTSAVAVGSQLSSILCSDSANYQVSKILDKHELELKLQKQEQQQEIDKLNQKLQKEINALNQKLQKQSDSLKEAQDENNTNVKIIANKDTELSHKELLVMTLRQQLENLQNDYKAKVLEVEEKLAQDDKRLEIAMIHLKNNFMSVLKFRIDTQFEWLANSISSKFDKKDYENIQEPLQALYKTLKEKHDSHYILVQEIGVIEGSNEEIVKDISEIFFQIFDEISGLKVRYRNTLNNDERLTLELAMEELNERRDTKKYIPYPKAKGVLAQYKVFQDEQIQGLHGKVQENFDEFNQLRAQVNDLVEAIEAKNLQIDDLKSQIKKLEEKLKEPLLWVPEVSHAQRAGNIIINFFHPKGYVLDRSHYIGDNYEADLYFHCSRNKPSSVLPKNLNEFSEYLGQKCECLAPVKFDWDTEHHLLKAHIVMHHRPKKVVTAEEIAVNVKTFLKPPENLIKFVREAYHVGLWAETGAGKTTAISNIIGGMAQELGNPTIRTTIPKMDKDIAELFPVVDWLGVPNSIFGMLEAALEIQYRIWLNEQAFLNGEEIKDFEPILFFIDEINLIFTRWRKVNDTDLANVLERFAETLSGERLEYFNTYMKLELQNYKNEFAKTLLRFIWQTGRSLRVKSLIGGQNLQPGSFGFMTNDLANCAYLGFGDCIEKCAEYKVRSNDAEEIAKQNKLILQAKQSDKTLKFAALFCPNKGKSFFSILPPPGYYEWDKNLLCPNRPKTVDTSVSNLDSGQPNVQERPIVDTKQDKSFKPFVQTSKLPKQYQNLSYEGSVQLWLDLPKKADGSVHKTQAYEKVFGVTRSNDRKIVSEFIDYLEANFR